MPTIFKAEYIHDGKFDEILKKSNTCTSILKITDFCSKCEHFKFIQHEGKLCLNVQMGALVLSLARLLGVSKISLSSDEVYTLSYKMKTVDDTIILMKVSSLSCGNGPAYLLFGFMGCKQSIETLVTFINSYYKKGKVLKIGGKTREESPSNRDIR